MPLLPPLMTTMQQQRGLRRPLDRKRTTATITVANLLAKSNATALVAILHGNSDFVRLDACRLAVAILADPHKGTGHDAPTARDNDDYDFGGDNNGGGSSKSRRRLSTAGDDAAAKEGRREVLNSRVARVMQALRIKVNGKFDALDSLLGNLPRILAPGGCAVFLNFDSGEYRRVKFAMKDGMRAGHYSGVSRWVIRAGPEEVHANPRRRCCYLRWCVWSAVAT